MLPPITKSEELIESKRKNKKSKKKKAKNKIETASEPQVLKKQSEQVSNKEQKVRQKSFVEGTSQNETISTVPLENISIQQSNNGTEIEFF